MLQCFASSDGTLFRLQAPEVDRLLREARAQRGRQPFFGQRAALHVLLVGDRHLAEQLQRVSAQPRLVCEWRHRQATVNELQPIHLLGRLWLEAADACIPAHSKALNRRWLFRGS